MLPDLSAAHIFILVVVALIVVGPKDLPAMLRKMGQFMGKLRGMANEFRASFDEMARQSELDELRREVEAMRAAAANPVVQGMNEMDRLITDPNNPDHMGGDQDGFAAAPEAASILPPPAEAPSTAKTKAKSKSKASPVAAKSVKSAKSAGKAKPVAKTKTVAAKKPKSKPAASRARS
jgi:sec-independent protein translocase protein TatB